MLVIRECILYDFKSCKFIETWFMAHRIFYVGECFISIWKKCIFWSYLIINITHLFSFCFVLFSIHLYTCWYLGVFIVSNNVRRVLKSLSIIDLSVLSQILFKVFWSYIFKSIHNEDCFVFWMNCFFIIMKFLSLVVFFPLKSTLADINIRFLIFFSLDLLLLIKWSNKG